MKITATRRTIFGWDFTTATETDYEIGMLVVQDVKKPYYTGTARQVSKSIAKDKTFNSLGGTYYNASWFVKTKKGFKKIVFDQWERPNDLLECDGPNGYYTNSIELEIED
jgi:hypothetical protein